MERNEQISHLFVLTPGRGKMRAAGIRVTRPMLVDLPPYYRTRLHTKVNESVLRRYSRGERYFSAL
jgi:hypothetical protein